MLGMFDFHEKRKIRNIVYSKLTIGVLLVLVILVGMSVFERFSALREISHKRALKEEELALLQERAEVLEEKVEYLQNGRGAEEELRNRFDLAREGEKVVVIVDDDSEAADTSLRDPSEADGEGHFSLWEWLTSW